jgi:hypothetical protein
MRASVETGEEGESRLFGIVMTAFKPVLLKQSEGTDKAIQYGFDGDHEVMLVTFRGFPGNNWLQPSSERFVKP